MVDPSPARSERCALASSFRSPAVSFARGSLLSKTTSTVILDSIQLFKLGVQQHIRNSSTSSLNSTASMTVKATTTKDAKKEKPVKGDEGECR
jgi:hypothetical protein